MSASANPSSALLVQDLRKYYGDVRAVDGLDLDVGAGECFGLLGPNGAGKTTTIEICEGLLLPDSGRVEILGLRWDREEKQLRQRLGIQLQETQLADKLTVAEVVRLFRSFYERGRTVDDVIRLVQLDEKRDGRVGKLSGGQKQRLALACAIVGDPDLLFLDEPTTGLDPQSRRQLWDLITDFKAHGRTILLTTHYMDEAEILCDRVAIVDHGKVIALGTPRELIRSLGAEHVVEFALSADGTQLDETTLRSIDGVRAARRAPAATSSGRRAPPHRARRCSRFLAAAQARAGAAHDALGHARGRVRVAHRPSAPGGLRRMAERDNPLVQLITVRFKEYTREPEALFWSFGFPILLAIGLGIAFRAKPPDVVHVAVADGSPQAATIADVAAARLGVGGRTHAAGQRACGAAHADAWRSSSSRAAITPSPTSTTTRARMRARRASWWTTTSSAARGGRDLAVGERAPRSRGADRATSTSSCRVCSA